MSSCGGDQRCRVVSELSTFGQVPDGVDPETAVREPVTEALESPGNARFEVQVGSTFAARAGNTVSHLLNEEEVHSAAVVRPIAPLLGRTHLDSAAMKLRSSRSSSAPRRAAASTSPGSASRSTSTTLRHPDGRDYRRTCWRCRPRRGLSPAVSRPRNASRSRNHRAAAPGPEPGWSGRAGTDDSVPR